MSADLEAVAGVLFAAVVGYWIGAINPAAWIARVRRIDLRGTGSGNPGATNAARAMGRGVGVVVGVLDAVKGFVPAYAFTRWGVVGAGEVAGVAAVVGHVTSPFLKGRGGKGVATTLGALLGVVPLWAVPVLVAFGIVAVLTRRMGLASAAGAVALLVTAIVAGPTLVERAFGVVLSGIVLWRHRTNLAEALHR